MSSVHKANAGALTCCQQLGQTAVLCSQGFGLFVFFPPIWLTGIVTLDWGSPDTAVVTLPSLGLATGVGVAVMALGRSSSSRLKVLQFRAARR